jgi:predicted ATPase
MPLNGIEYITIKGFKSIASIEQLELRPINILIGANGSGKSNFLGVFQLLRAVAELRLSNYVGAAGGADKVLHFGSKTTEEIAVALRHSDREFQFKFAPTGDDGLYLVNQDAQPTFLNGGDPSDTELIRSLAATWRVYHLHDISPMQKTGDVDDNRSLRQDGANLAAFLYFLREKQPASYALIRRTIQSAAPFFEDFSLEPQAMNRETIKLEWKHTSSDQHFGASSLSDGTLRFIALATLFLQPASQRPIIIVDEPELGLHPYAIGMLASLIRQASNDSQVIVSTQSPTLLDYFQPGEVLVADRVDGGTQLTRPDSTRLAKWLEDYSLGQLWEKNEIGGRPVQG